ncbi:MAG: pantetheine-phosphate adenylyltransferase [Sphaerochaetaceae bacterium]|nr:pantetheine-phosphate adenylyltransferase [Sphaerochaetaceae bacterium]
MSKLTAVFPGSFDPVTNGHIDVIRRASKLFDTLYVAVGDNINKKTLFTANERKLLIEEAVKDLENVKVEVFSGLTVSFAEEKGAKVIIKGVRSSEDYNYEYEMAETNSHISPDIETLFMPSRPEYFFVRSSTVKEMVKFKADVSDIVPENVNRALLAVSDG